MFSGLFGPSLPRHPSKDSPSRLVDRLRREWNFDAFYQTVVQRIETAHKRGDTAVTVPLAGHEPALRLRLEERLRRDGFVVEPVEASAESGARISAALLVSGWASAESDGGDAVSVDDPMAVSEDLATRSSLWVHHITGWEAELARLTGRMAWMLGERVLKDGIRGSGEHLTADAMSEAHSLLFVGMSGSGKTEGMRAMMASFIAANPGTRLSICDTHRTSDWDVFAPFAEGGVVHKDEGEALGAIREAGDELDRRLASLRAAARKNILQWSEEDPATAPKPYVLLIEELPHLRGALKWDIESRRAGTAANALFRIMTVGRSAGVFLVIGAQCATHDHFPSEILKNLKRWVIFRVGSEGESMQLVASPAAFQLGRRAGDHRQQGYAYIDGKETLVRFHMMQDAAILYALLASGVPVRSPQTLPLSGSRQTLLEAPHEIRHRAQAGEGTEADRREIERYRRMNEKLERQLFNLLAKARGGVV